MSLQPLKADHILVIRYIIVLSLPSRERGLKFDWEPRTPWRTESLPSRERGLKYLCLWVGLPISTSLPSRERGLKSDRVAVLDLDDLVAPFTGAWIEI